MGRLLVTHPLTLAALGLVAAFEATALVWFGFRPLWTSVFGGVGLAAFGLWLLLLSRDKALRRAAVTEISIDPALRTRVETLRADLAEVGFARGLEQLAGLERKVHSLLDVLHRRTAAGGWSLAPYADRATQVYRAAVDNLSEIAIAAASVRTIDPQHIAELIADAERRPDSPEKSRQIEALSKRQSLYDEKRRRIDALAAQTEAAMTALDDAAAALARAGRHEATGVEVAMKALEDLASRGPAIVADATPETTDAIARIDRFIASMRTQKIPDPAVAQAIERMVTMAKAIAHVLAETPDRLSRAWDFIDYALPRAGDIVPDYVALAETAALSADQSVALGRIRETLLDLPDLFEAYHQALRDDDVQALLEKTNALKLIAFDVEALRAAR